MSVFAVFSSVFFPQTSRAVFVDNYAGQIWDLTLFYFLQNLALKAMYFWTIIVCFFLVIFFWWWALVGAW